VNYSDIFPIYEQLNSVKKYSPLVQDLTKAATRYARIRVDWLMTKPEDRLQIDRSRSFAHDSFIDSCNILSRNMAKNGDDITWRTKIGDDRKSIGDFACFLHCYLGIKAR